jgi:death-on-curing protein
VEKLGKNHPFIDGNKCVAFAATFTFLAIDGARLVAEAEETCHFIHGLYTRDAFSFHKIVPWLQQHVRLQN